MPILPAFSSPGVLRNALAIVLSALLGLAFAGPISAQDTVTGAFDGIVTDSANGVPIPRATVQIINQHTQVPVAKRTDAQGRFYQGLLQPGFYTIRVSAPGYQARTVDQRLVATRENRVNPLPIKLDPEAPAPPSPPTPESAPAPKTAIPVAQPAPLRAERGWTLLGNVGEIIAEISAATGRRGAFTEAEVAALPLGAGTLVRSFDELSFKLMGVALPPQTLGGMAGPGVGSGVGSAGQFAVNGLRSRANNFTVDGSDNNDEDIGVRRQGFFSLVPQPIESIREYQVITHLAPAQFGRNFGAQVNAVSKSGGNQTHGSLYGIFNSSDLNARDFFDTTNGNDPRQLIAGQNQPVLLDGQPLMVSNGSGGKDSSTFGNAGFTVGGPLSRTDSDSGRSAFYFLSAEGQLLNANREASFAVPTVEERGFGRTGATGIFRPPFPELFSNGSTIFAYPTTADADSIFSLFPFANNPGGVYGPNTFTQTLPASAQGLVASGRVDGSFKFHGREQSVAARYNLTDDWRTIPVTGGAVFSTLRPRVRTQNFSAFLNSELSGPQATIPIFNQLRLSYGRTRLRFDDERRLTFGLEGGVLRLPSKALPNEPFLLNAREIGNYTLPDPSGGPNRGSVKYITTGFTTEEILGPVGQINIAGFSPAGVDVFNFPQRRVNNTYQIADTLTLRTGVHSLAFGADMRRSELNSELPRNSRPLITFAGAPTVSFNPETRTVTLRNNFIPGVDLAAASAASGFQQTFATGPSDIALRYYQLNFFAQDEWRLRPNLSLSYGLRYEYNTSPGERRKRIESALNSPALDAVPDLRHFIEGRTKIFETDSNDVAPRVGVAYSPNLFGPERTTVIRAGYGLFYDQILGAVVSQSRNVFPTFLTANFAGGGFGREFGLLTILNPYELFNSEPSWLAPGTINRIIPGISSEQLVRTINRFVTGRVNPAESVLGATLPARRLRTPMAHHYSLGIEQQLGPNTVFSAAYVGTLGRNLLRFTTPNLGSNEFLLPLGIDVNSNVPEVSGFAFPPGTRITSDGFIVGGRPLKGVGSVNIFETTARSRYDSLQLQLRGRFHTALQYQLAYTFSKAIDDVSDVFDLAGASALPQRSCTPLDAKCDYRGERGLANFDTRHRFAYNFIYSFPDFRNYNSATRLLLGGWGLAGTGEFQSGQPFTVNSIYDVNLDGNLTDRLHRLSDTDLLQLTDNRRQPLLRMTNDFGQLATLLAPAGNEGDQGRNTFRAGNYLLLNLALIKQFTITEDQQLIFRVDFFNILNRANFGVPVRLLEAPGFGAATETVTPGRRIQFALKYLF
ncbi:MAG: TonB-dependent receptor [Blastocatellales bacterium]